jgi:hypothetical protein
MMDAHIEELVQMVKSASPAIWSAAKHQVIADIVTEIVFLIIGGILLYWALRKFKSIQRDKVEVRKKGGYMTDTDGHDFSMVALIALMVVVSLAMSIVSVSMIQECVAPDYAAIQYVARLVHI